MHIANRVFLFVYGNCSSWTSIRRRRSFKLFRSKREGKSERERQTEAGGNKVKKRRHIEQGKIVKEREIQTLPKDLLEQLENLNCQNIFRFPLIFLLLSRSLSLPFFTRSQPILKLGLVPFSCLFNLLLLSLCLLRMYATTTC